MGHLRAGRLLAVIALLAAFLIGPERLPVLAEKLGALVRGLRDLAGGAKERMREEIGPEFDEVDWQKLDPRQYDPRRIIRDALLDSGGSAAAVQTAQVTASKVRATAPVVPLAVGEAAPFDAEAT